MTLFESSSQSVFLFERDLRANAFRVCREGKPVPTFPDHAPRWRTAEALIPSAKAPTRFPIGAGGAPVHCPKWRSDGGLAPQRLAAPVCFQGSAGTLVRFVIQGSKFGHHDRTRTYIPDLRRVVLIQLSYVVRDAGGRTAPPAPLLLELDVPVQIVAPGLVQKVRREQTLGRHQVVLRRLERLPHRLEVEAVLARVARAAGRHDVRPGRLTAVRARQDVIERQFAVEVLVAAILATEAIAEEDVEPGEGYASRRPHIRAPRDDRRQPHHRRRAADNLVVFCDDDVRSLYDRLDRVLPVEQRQREIAERLEVSVEDKGWICCEHCPLLSLVVGATGFETICGLL